MSASLENLGQLRIYRTASKGSARRELGHIVFWFASDPILVFAGDVLFHEGIGRTDFPDGDFSALESGILDKLYSLPDSAIVLPGHGDPTTIRHEKKHNPFVSQP